MPGQQFTGQVGEFAPPDVGVHFHPAPVEGGRLSGNLAMARAIEPSQREAGDYA